MNATASAGAPSLLNQGSQPAQPNELDLRRIVRLLELRVRYRYVKPLVVASASGYRIQSPCCSRNIDADGAIIDIAWLEYDVRIERWNLFRKDHAQGAWQLYFQGSRLADAMKWLNEDPARVFWQ